MKKNPFVKVCMYVATLMLGVALAGCIAEPAEPDVETAITHQDSFVATTSSTCTLQTLQCCNSLQPVNSFTVTQLATLLGVSLPVSGLVGLTCTPYSGACVQQPACCTGGNYGGGALVLSCTPVNPL